MRLIIPHIVNNWSFTTLLQSLRDLCDAHGVLKQNLDSDALFSWNPISAGHDRPMHRSNKPQVWSGGAIQITTSTGTSTKTRWATARTAATPYRFFPPFLPPPELCRERASRSRQPTHAGRPNRSPTKVPFRHFHSSGRESLGGVSPGILHRINQLEGERYSIAVNIWQSESLTTQDSAPPA